MKKQKEKVALKAEINKENIWAYITGNIRYFLFYSEWFGFLLPQHIREQIEFRLKFMDRECFNNSECKICGCHTPQLQCASKACDKPCYPEMMNKTDWSNFIKGRLLKVDKSGMWEYFPPHEEAMTHRGEDYTILEAGGEKLVRYIRTTKKADINKAFTKSEFLPQQKASTKLESIPLDTTGQFGGRKNFIGDDIVKDRRVYKKNKNK